MIADLPTRGLLPVPEVARLLGVSPRYVRDRVKAARIFRMSRVGTLT
jgi:hypothetical protein